VGIFSRFSKAYRVCDSTTYRETIASAEKIAAASYGLLAGKPADEQKKILERVNSLSEKPHDAVDDETPLIVALTLLMTIHEHGQMMQKHVDRARASE
jgi:hypothetical protein